jgi:hypothetical protein
MTTHLHVVIEEDVAELQVAVDDLVLVEVLHSEQDLNDVNKSFFFHLRHSWERQI